MNCRNDDKLVDEISDILRSISNLEKKDISVDANIYSDLGIDSIKGIELIVAIYEKYGIQINDYKIPNLVTIKDLANEVRLWRLNLDK